MPAFKLAAELKQYAEDAEISETPWELWEYKAPLDKEWSKLPGHPVWDESKQYRRIKLPQTTTYYCYELSRGILTWINSDKLLLIYAKRVPQLDYTVTEDS